MIVSLLAESFNVAIIDLACTKTVCSEVWMQYYTDSLSVSDKDKINICKSSNSFKFGKIKLTPDATDYEIPLLLSKDSMEKVHAMTDFKNDKMIMFGTGYIIHNDSGHYGILLNNFILKK